MSKRQPSPLDVLEARVAQLAAALAVLAPKVGEAETGAKPLRASPPPANDRRASGA